MDGYIVHGSIGMTRGSVLRIEDGEGMLVYVWEGGLWLTQEGDGRDRYLAPGQWFMLDRDGVAVIHSLRRSVVTLTAPQPVLYARRVTLSIAGRSMTRVLYDAARESARIGERTRITLARLRIALARWWTSAFAPHARVTSASL